MERFKKLLHEGAWVYSLNVIEKINKHLLSGSKPYLQEEEMISSELEKFTALALPILSAKSSDELIGGEVTAFFDSLDNKEVLSNFYFAAYQKLRNRLKFELLFLDENSKLDEEKCNAYLTFEKRLEHNVDIVHGLLGLATRVEYVKLESFILFCSLMNNLLPVHYSAAIDEQVVDLRINIYENKERIAYLKENEGFRINRISVLEALVNDYERTAQYYEQQVIGGKNLGAFFIKDFISIF